MSIFTKQEIVSSCNAYDVVERESFNEFNVATRKNVQVINLVDSETLVMQDYSHGIFRIGSVVSYSLESNRCPIEAVERAVKNGHNLHWISAQATWISSSKQERVTHISVNTNDIYKFQGKYFKIAHDSNKNLKLVEVELK